MFGYNDLANFFVHKICHELGIVPTTGGYLRAKINDVLKALPPDEAMKMKRKFRKLWRKEMKRQLKALHDRQAKFASKHGLPADVARVSAIALDNRVKRIKGRFVPPPGCPQTGRQASEKKLIVMHAVLASATHEIEKLKRST